MTEQGNGRGGEPVGLHCQAGTLAVLVIAGSQAFRDNDGGRPLMRDPAQTRAEMLAEGVREAGLRRGGEAGAP